MMRKQAREYLNKISGGADEQILAAGWESLIVGQTKINMCGREYQVYLSPEIIFEVKAAFFGSIEGKEDKP
jgi:hypothetical protein